MKKRTTAPARSNLSVLRQLLNFIPLHLVPRLARECGADKRSRTFTPWSQVVSLMYAHLVHCIGLNDVCDSLQLHSGPLSAIRGAKAPCRNTLSHANRQRDASMAEKLFWSVLEHLQKIHPPFARGRKGKGLLHRFKVNVHAVDSTTIELVANCIDWAKHRRRKAAAKTHLRLNLQSFLPSYAVIDTAKEHDAKRAREVCAGLQSGEIVVFDKAYLDYDHLADLDERGIFWVTRAKENMAFIVVKKRPVKKGGRLVRDEIVALEGRSHQPGEFVRRIEAWVEVDGRECLMFFLTNNMEWSPRSVCDLYRARWDIEVFFKQLKQTLKLSDFLGHSANAVRWQVWTALLTYVLLRFQACVGRWAHSFTRLFTLLRATLWQRLDLPSLLKRYGTAGGHFKLLGAPEQAWLPKLFPSNGTAH
ncbi:MAG: IS4 family transposase [Verrucomicrobiales bacterium]